MVSATSWYKMGSRNNQTASDVSAEILSVHEHDEQYKIFICRSGFISYLNNVNPLAFITNINPLTADVWIPGSKYIVIQKTWQSKGYKYLNKIFIVSRTKSRNKPWKIFSRCNFPRLSLPVDLDHQTEPCIRRWKITHRPAAIHSITEVVSICLYIVLPPTCQSVQPLHT